MQQRQLHDLPQLLQGLLRPSHIIIRHIGLVFHGHQRHRRIDLRRQRNLDRVLGPVDADAHPFLDVRRRNLLAQPDDELGDLLHVDDVLGLLRLFFDHLGAPRHLKRLLLLHHLLVRHQVPLRRNAQPRVRLLDPDQLLHRLLVLLDVVLHLLQRHRVGALPITLEQLDVAAVQLRRRLLLRRILLVVVLVRRLARTRIVRHREVRRLLSALLHL
mmetsp:Transcript_3605/g.11856  ORF Transcript_3605/g.11856 Transcript_3605/m.11856 type:complete len:215 (-) Transcript_3605:3-647(-)